MGGSGEGPEVRCKVGLGRGFVQAGGLFSVVPAGVGVTDGLGLLKGS